MTNEGPKQNSSQPNSKTGASEIVFLLLPNKQVISGDVHVSRMERSNLLIATHYRCHKLVSCAREQLRYAKMSTCPASATDAKQTLQPDVAWK